MRRLQLNMLRGWHLAFAASLLMLPLQHAVSAEPSPPTAQTQPDAAQPGVPPRPEEPRALKAYLVFDRYCARCHQSGKTETPLASGTLANILDVAAQALDPLRVRPGLPDASPLYDILATRHAPLDIYDNGGAASEPSPDDIEDVREWITALAPAVQTCQNRKAITRDARDTWMRDALILERDQAKDLRFFSLIHLYNACVPLKDIEGYGKALVKLINGLSWAAEPATLTKLDPYGTLFSLKLSSVRWTEQQWQLITRDYPVLPKVVIPGDIVTASGDRLPVVNGDWFAAAAGEPPLYYELLHLPANLAALAKLNGVDIDKDIRTSAARRIAIRNSAVTRGNRLAERHSGSNGAMWLVYDFATSAGAQDLLERPLGPKATPTIKTPFIPDEIRVAFALPNGFYAYAVFDGAGHRVDRVLPGIEKPFAGVESNALEPVTKPGANCMACHQNAVLVQKDDFRPYATNPTATLPEEIRKLALAAYSPDSETALLAAGDNERYRKSLEIARIDPARTVRGEEIVSALAHAYRGGSDLKAAAALADIDRSTFLKTLSGAKGPAAALARRLQQGVLPRADLDRLFALLAGGNGKPELPKGGGGFLRDVKSEIGLSVWIDKLIPAKNDLVTIKAQADTDCYLTLISIDAAGKATVIFPNEFEKDNLVQANTTIKIPGPDAPYQLRFKADGTETLMGRCSTSPVPPMGIEHDYIRQRFTVLGNWENFIEDTLVTEAEMRTSPQKAARARVAREAARSRSRRTVPDPDARPTTAPGEALRDGRAVVIIQDE